MRIRQYFNMFLNGMAYFQRWERSPGQPMIFQVETTNLCPMRCKMCPRTYDMKRDIGFMDMKVFDKVLKEMKGYTNEIFLHHFGDPLVDPNIYEAIDICHKWGVKAKLSTNPTTMKPDICEKVLDAGLDFIHISLDGMDDKTYKFLRGPAANFEKAVKNITHFLELKKKRGLKKPYVNIAMIAMKENMGQVEKFKEFWMSKGADNIEIKQFRTWDGSIPEIVEMADDSQKSDRHKQERQKDACYQPWMWMTVLWDGRVVPCCYDYDGKFVLGNIKNESLKEIWNGKRMRELRKQHITGKGIKDNPLCGTCNEYGSSKKSRIYPLNFFTNKEFRDDISRYFRVSVDFMKSQETVDVNFN